MKHKRVLQNVIYKMALRLYFVWMNHAIKMFVMDVVVSGARLIAFGFWTILKLKM